MNRGRLHALFTSATTSLLGSTVVATAHAQEDIRDIRGPIPIPAGVPWFTYLVAAALIVALALISLRVYRWYNARRKSPYQIASERLNAAASLIAPERGAVVAEAVSDAVREYIEARFALRASHKTTEEFLSDLITQSATLPALAPHRDDLTKFLAQCDLAKFSARPISESQMQELHGAATTFIERTHAAVLAASKPTRRRFRLSSTQADGATP